VALDGAHWMLSSKCTSNQDRTPKVEPATSG
jgi:hypothetical protein